MKQYKIMLIGLISGLGFKAQAQESPTSAGGNAFSAGGSVSYSVGQIGYTSNTGSNGSVASGVQQPFEISVMTGIEPKAKITLAAFPNPTTGILTLTVKNAKTENLTYQITDVEGKLVFESFLTGKTSKVNLSDKSSGTYFISIIEDNKAIKSFKIIKN